MSKSNVLPAFLFGCLTVAVMPMVFNQETALQREIATNEAICQKEQRLGYAVYVVSRHAQLRGCIRVKQDPVNGVVPAPIMIVKHQPL